MKTFPDIENTHRELDRTARAHGLGDTVPPLHDARRAHQVDLDTDRQNALEIIAAIVDKPRQERTDSECFFLGSVAHLISQAQQV